MNEYIILHRATDLGTLLEVRTIHEFGTKNTLEGERNFVRFKDITKEDFLCNESPAETEALIMGRNESNWRECMREMDKEISDGYTDYKELENRYKILQEENAKLKEQLDIAAHDFKYSHFALPSITANEDPIDYLSDKVNRLIYELEKLEKENAELKKELDALINDLTYPTLIRTGMFADLDWGQLSERLQHSNEENSKLKEQLETLKQRSEKWVADINGLQFKNACLKEENERLAANQRIDNWRDHVALGPLDHHQLRARLEHSNPANPCCRETYLKLHEALCTVSRNDRLDLINWDQSFIDAIRESKND